MLARSLAVLAACLLVGAIALGTLGPQDMSLSEALAAADPAAFAATEAWLHVHLATWLWDHPVKGLLGRPAWLLPTALGILLAGSAMSVATAAKAPNTRRRRS